MMAMFETSLDCSYIIIDYQKYRVGKCKYHTFSTFNSTKTIMNNCIFKSLNKEF